MRPRIFSGESFLAQTTISDLVIVAMRPRIFSGERSIKECNKKFDLMSQ